MDLREALSGGLVSPETLGPLVAISPNSAFRGLVLGTAVGDVFTRSAPTGSPLVNVLGLLAWLVAGLVVAVRTVWSS